jgi:aminoglycoside 2'-N-acetyltransferase I
MRWELRRVADLTESEQAALRTLALAVYPPDVSAAWPGRAIEWAAHQWGVIAWGVDGAALCYVGVVLRDARWDYRTVKVGGIGGVKTHPDFRGRGFATAAIRRALDFFREQGDVDFGLLVCEPSLVSFYERHGWRRVLGDLFVTQHQATVPFTFNVAMTTPVRFLEPLTGAIDLLGPPW